MFRGLSGPAYFAEGSAHPGDVEGDSIAEGWASPFTQLPHRHRRLQPANLKLGRSGAMLNRPPSASPRHRYPPQLAHLHDRFKPKKKEGKEKPFPPDYFRILRGAQVDKAPQGSKALLR